MAREIERKFLVSGDGWRAAATNGRHMLQAYLASGANASVRIRIVDGVAAALAVKSRETGIARDEFEYEIPLADALAMQRLAVGDIIEKRRYELVLGDNCWEVDVYEGQLTGLVVAECELAAADAVLALPGWVGDEISGDPRYANEALALNGLPLGTRAAGQSLSKA